MINLETPRLLLRETTPEDTAGFFGFVNRDDYLLFMPFGKSTEKQIKHTLSEEVTHDSDEPRKFWRISIILKENHKLIGDIQLSRDPYKWGGLAKIGYGINPDYWNHGYLTEALKTVTAWAHDSLKFHRIQAHCHVDNVASWRVLEKAGYEREGVARYVSYNSKDNTWDKADYVYASTRPEMVRAK